ncbi:MAG: hypothetical protein ABSE62_02690 [Chthoniobacteraceae bacterium]
MIVVIVVVKLWSVRHASEENRTPVAAAAPSPARSVAPAPTAALTVEELTRADWPASVTLLISTQIPFKKGSHFVTKDITPLFFYSQYWSDAKPGDEFEILDYDPERERVYLSSTNSAGEAIALNALESFGYCRELSVIPANKEVQLLKVVGNTAFVSYLGDRFVVPIGDTDLLDRAAKIRARGGASGPASASGGQMGPE